jgi:hypothetical protein
MGNQVENPLKATIPAYQRAKADIKFADIKFTQTKKVRLDV